MGVEKRGFKKMKIPDDVEEIEINLFPPRKIRVVGNKRRNSAKNYIAEITGSAKIQLTKND